MNVFVELFKKYGFEVEPFGKGQSFIATNDKYCLPCTVSEQWEELFTVTFPADAKKRLEVQYENTYIGQAVHRDRTNYSLEVFPSAGIWGNDLRLHEVEAWLISVTK